MIHKCEDILKHGINCFINRQLIYNLPEQFFAERGVMAIEHADFEGIERLSLVLGADIVSTFDNPEKVKLGTCKLIEEIMIGEDKVFLHSYLFFIHSTNILFQKSLFDLVEFLLVKLVLLFFEVLHLMF